MYKGVLEWDLKLDLQRLLKSAFLESLHNEAYTNMQMNKIKGYNFIRNIHCDFKCLCFYMITHVK